MKRGFLWMTVLTAAASVAVAEDIEYRHFVQHNPNLVLNTHYEFTSLASVRIKEGLQGETFQFEYYATDTAGRYIGARTIEAISVKGDAGPYVSVSIAPHQVEAIYGAQRVRSLNLTALNTTARMAELVVENLGDEDSPDADVHLGTGPCGSISIANQARGHIIVESFVSGSTVTIGDGHGWHSAGGLYGQLEILGTGPHDVDVTIWNLVSPHELTIHGSSTGQIRVGAPHCGTPLLSGTVNIAGDAHDLVVDALAGLTGHINVGGDLYDLSLRKAIRCYNGVCGAVHVTGNLVGNLNVGTDGGADLEGTVEIDRDLSGKIEILQDGPCGNGGRLTGTITVNTDIAGGRIRVDGALGATGAPGAIIVGGQIRNNGYICTDWNGHCETDYQWVLGSYFQLGNQPYDEPHPELRVFRVTCCPGDMNNDSAVGFADIDAFVAAIPDTPAEIMDAQFPAHGGSTWYHGDINGDGRVTFADIDPFVALIPSGCPLTCGGEELLGGGEMEMLMMEGGGATSEGQAALAGAIDAAIENGDGPAGPEYWQAVFENAGEM